MALATFGTLAGKGVVITGAAAGIGRATALYLAGEGVRVVVSDIDADAGKGVVAEIQAARGTAEFVACDVSSESDVESLIERSVSFLGGLDFAVNNAGLALGLEPAQEADVDQWEQMIETNCTGLVYVTRAFLPQMVARGRGHVVNLGSIAGTYPYPGGNVYGATKAFVHQFSLNLRSDLHGTGIRVTSVEPGLSGGTEFSQVRFGGDREKAGAVYAGTQPLTADDIAAAIEWATSQPPHVNVNVIELMPVSQSFAPFQVYRGDAR